MDMNESLLIRALQRKAVPRTPLWFMRQAGRYLPEYRALRVKAGSFMNLCKTPRLAAEATLQPLARFPLDAAIIFSDILTIPDALGLGLFFEEGEGPRFKYPIDDLKGIEALPEIEVSKSLDYVFEAIRQVRQNMPADLPLIGFSGSPWTLACYMIEGGSSKQFKKALSLMYTQPAVMQFLLEKLTALVIAYLSEQVKAGASVLMIFDSWGGILPTARFHHFSLFYMEQIVKALKKTYPQCPLILFTKGGGQWLKEMADTGCDALSLDWTIDLKQARKQVGAQVALQGNLDPQVLLTSPACIQQEVKAVLQSYGRGSGHVFNLGHGITPDVPPENVLAMVEAVRELSPLFMDLSYDHCEQI